MGPERKKTLHMVMRQKSWADWSAGLEEKNKKPEVIAKFCLGQVKSTGQTGKRGIN